ncbi:MAG: Gfo/Idh/MocA family oxidoreductase [Planctomycetes bacterium]|nr:Gfo/Idh/MocA family oxidoreductase [Planctomycetota bacterium]
MAPARRALGRPPRVAVVGVGGFGRHHARIYGELTQAGEAKLVGLVDRDVARAKEHGDKVGVPVVARLEDLPERPDAVTVAVPTSLHGDVAEPLLRAGVHCLVEKPVASTSAQARRLVEAARAGGAVLAVGHVERFNPVLAAVERLGVRPVFLEVHRLAPYTFRSRDVGVVMDLMIHDLDIVLHLVGEAPSRVEAVGVPVIGPHEDIANARLDFPSGAVANVTASRVSINRMRKIRVFSKDAYVSLDYDKRQAVLVKTTDRLREVSEDPAALAALAAAGTPLAFADLVSSEFLAIDDAEPLKEELRGFVAAVREGGEPRVGGEDGARALALAETILASIASRPRPRA